MKKKRFYRIRRMVAFLLIPFAIIWTGGGTLYQMHKWQKEGGNPYEFDTDKCLKFYAHQFYKGLIT